MLMRQVTALTIAVVLACLAPLAFAQQSGQIAGSAKDEAKKPYTDYEVRARVVTNGTVAAKTQLDATSKFLLRDLSNEKYLVELFDSKKKAVVCTEGPFALTPDTPSKMNVNIKCGIKTSTYVLAAAAAAGIAAAVTRNPASPAR